MNKNSLAREFIIGNQKNLYFRQFFTLYFFLAIQLYSLSQTSFIKIDSSLNCDFPVNNSEYKVDTFQLESTQRFFIIKYSDSAILQISVIQPLSDYNSFTVHNYAFHSNTLSYFFSKDFYNEKFDQVEWSIDDDISFFSVMNESDPFCTKIVDFTTPDTIRASLFYVESVDPLIYSPFYPIKDDLAKWNDDFMLLREEESEYFKYFATSLLTKLPIILYFDHFTGYKVRKTERISDHNNQNDSKKKFIDQHPAEVIMLEEILTREDFVILKDSTDAMLRRFGWNSYLGTLNQKAITMLRAAKSSEMVDQLIKENQYREASRVCFNLAYNYPENKVYQNKLQSIVDHLKGEFNSEFDLKAETLIANKRYIESLELCDSLLITNPENEYLRFLKMKSNSLFNSEQLLELGQYYFQRNKLWIADTIYEEYQKRFPNDVTVINRRNEILNIWLED